MGWEFSKNGEKQQATASTISQNSNDMNMKGKKLQNKHHRKTVEKHRQHKNLMSGKRKKKFLLTS